MGGCRFALLACAALIASACALSEISPGDVPAARQALTSAERLVSLRTFDQLHYLTAEADGGGTVSTDRSLLGPWERWLLSDLDGGELESGDAIALRHVRADGASFYLVADSNGGGPGSVLRANRQIPQSWETFIVEKPGGGAIASGDPVQLRAASAPFYVCAEHGGGRAGDGAVVVDRAIARSWETFTLETIGANELCPDGSFCLFENPSFDGQRFEVRALDPEQGVCVNLVEHGWGARARSAINAGSKTASILPNPDCTGEPVGIPGNSAEATLPLLPNSAFVY